MRYIKYITLHGIIHTVAGKSVTKDVPHPGYVGKMDGVPQTSHLKKSFAVLFVCYNIFAQENNLCTSWSCGLAQDWTIESVISDIRNKCIDDVLAKVTG